MSTNLTRTGSCIWGVKLANDLDMNTNSDRLVLMSVWPSCEEDPLKVCDISRRAMEGSPEWLLKVTRRMQKIKTRKYAINLQHGGGYETILLVDGAEIPENGVDEIQRVSIHVMVDSISSEESLQRILSRHRTSGVISVKDYMHVHCKFIADKFKTDNSGVRIYLHPSNSLTPSNGTDRFDSRHVFRIRTDVDSPFQVEAIQRCSDTEDLIRSRHPKNVAALHTSVEVRENLTNAPSPASKKKKSRKRKLGSMARR